MTQGKKYSLPLKRKRQHRTDYKARLKLLISGRPRLVVRKSLNNILTQLVNFHPQGDKTIASAHSRELLSFGWKAHRGNLPSAYLLGYLLGLKAKKHGVTEAVLDIGLHKAVPGSTPFAVAKGALDAGLHLTQNISALPSEEALNGTTISLYTTFSSPQFSQTLKRGLTLSTFPGHLQEVKKKIQAQWH